MPSERKAERIYRAVTEAVVDARIALRNRPATDTEDLDLRLFDLMLNASRAAVEAYREPLSRPRRPSGE